LFFTINTVATITFFHIQQAIHFKQFTSKIGYKLNNASENKTMCSTSKQRNGAFCAGASFDNYFPLIIWRDGKNSSQDLQMSSMLTKMFKIIVDAFHGKAI
jgi:hypothetical protein